MTVRMLAVAVLGAAAMAVASPDAAAFGKRSRGGCDSPCGMSGGACGASYTVSYVDKTVTAYKTEWKTKQVEMPVTEYKMVEEAFKYMVCEAQPGKTTVKVSKMVYSQQPYQYTAYEMQQVPGTVKVYAPKMSTKEVPY